MKLISFVVALCLSLAASAQDFPLEAVVLQHDRTGGCYPGDTIHFNLQVQLDSVYGQPTDLSRVAYVQLLMPDGTILCSRKLKLDDKARASHWIAIDSIYPSGFYELRAFTRYMTNWNDYNYYTTIMPVFCPESRLGKTQQKGVRYINMTSPRIMASQYSVWWQPGIYVPIKRLVQPVEKQLMVFGHIVPKAFEPLPGDSILANRHLKIGIYCDGKSYVGAAETDYKGRFALYFPDVAGEWNMMMWRDPDYLDMSRHNVRLDEFPVPRQRKFSQDEIAPKLFGYRKFSHDTSANGVFFRHYHCDAAANMYHNRGLVSLPFYEWLGTVDNNFTRAFGFASPLIANVQRDTTFNKQLDRNLFVGNTSADPRTVCVDGVGYDVSPVVWIVNGCYRMVTNLKKKITDFEVLRPTDKSIPQYLDEVESVVVTNDPNIYKSYVRCSVLEKKHPITVLIKLHDKYVWDDSGLVSTQFHGYDNLDQPQQ